MCYCEMIHETIRRICAFMIVSEFKMEIKGYKNDKQNSWAIVSDNDNVDSFYILGLTWLLISIR